MDQNLHQSVLAEVRRDMAALERKLTELRAVEAYHSAKCANTTHKNGMPSFQSAVSHDQSDEFSGMGQREAAIKIMRAAGRPMRCGDIARAMMSGGFEYSSVGKLSNALFTSFSRGPKHFRKVGAGLWELISEPPEEGDE